MTTPGITPAGPGDLIRPPHGIFDTSCADMRAPSWVSPSRRLFSRTGGLSGPEEVVRVSAGCEVEFLPPPA